MSVWWNWQTRQTQNLLLNKHVGSSPTTGTIYGSIVQLVRTLACHARGRGFKSHWNRHSLIVG